MATSHSIVLTSALCKDTYPNNHGGDFVNNLNTTLELNEAGHEWVVSLSEISYLPDSWYNVRTGFNEISFSMHSFPCTTYTARKLVLANKQATFIEIKDGKTYYRKTRMLE